MKNKKEKPFSAPRWNDLTIPKVVGHVEPTAEDKKKAEEWAARIHREYGTEKDI